MSMEGKSNRVDIVGVDFSSLSMITFDCIHSMRAIYSLCGYDLFKNQHHLTNDCSFTNRKRKPSHFFNI